jgi:hypothetical protein
VTRKSCTRHWDCTYANGFNVLAEGIDVVMLRDCSVIGNVSFWAVRGLGGGGDISLVSFSQILFLDISKLEYENNTMCRFQVSRRHDTAGCVPHTKGLFPLVALQPTKYASLQYNTREDQKFHTTFRQSQTTKPN